MPIQITRYLCEHCLKKTYADKSAAKAHEKRCFWNPEVKSCVSCGNRGYDPREDGDAGDCWCTIKKKQVITKGCVVRDCPYWTERFEDYWDWVGDDS